MLTALSTRMFLLAATITLLGLALLAGMMVRIHTNDLEDQVIQGAIRLSDTIVRSTRYSMLQNRKDDVYKIVSAVGAQPGIERIRLYNKEGLITFSTLEGERGGMVDTAAEACNHCHTNDSDAPVSALRKEELTRVFRADSGYRVLGLIEPIYNEPSCSAVECHPPPEEQSILGVLDIQTSLAGVDATVKRGNQQFLFLTYCFMLVIASACGLFIWLFVHRPVKALIRGTRRLAKGDLDHRIEVQSRSEIGQLGDSFNRMAEELADARGELTDWTRTLEQRVAERTKTLKQAQAKMLQNEKLVSLGSLSAVVAHEINNPLSGILTYTKLVRKKLGNDHTVDDLNAIVEYLEVMESEIIRCGKIVSNLLEFSRQSAMIIGDTRINTLVEKTVFLIGHKLELQKITLVTDLAPDLPTITCDADRIQQAILAVLINAVEAMPDGGNLHVATRACQDCDNHHPCVEVAVADSGCGIPDEILPHLFEPFYTTKENKKGVGLGLSVVYGIVKRHQGRIDVESRLGNGTTVTLVLPVRPKVEQELLDTDTELEADSDETVPTAYVPTES